MDKELKKIKRDVHAGKKAKAEKELKSVIRKDKVLDRKRDMLEKKVKMKGKC